MLISDLMTAWTHEPSTQGEETWTPWGGGWHAWNRTSAEVEFCEWVGSLVALLQPSLTIETGVGAGYSSRRIIANLGEKGTWLGYESDPSLRAALLDLPWPSHLAISTYATPTAEEMGSADLVLLDSDMDYRVGEIDLWEQHGKPSSILLVHDVSGRHDPTPRNNAVHRRLYTRLKESGGIFLSNPRGSWVGQHG